MKKNKTLKVIASSTMISSLVLSAIATPIMAKEGWNEINGSWTYESNGSKQTGWSKIGNSWFSFDKNGTMQTGWTASGEFWYWLSPGSGVMQDNGWITDGSNQPFFIEPNGVMATDTVKDGYEIKADGTRVLLSDSNSVVLGAEGLPEGTVVEGNLYVTADAAKDLELKGITVKGKLVIEGGQNVKLTDSNIQGLKMNQADAVVTLSGKTEVKNAELTKQGTLEGDKNYKGEVENVKIASLVKGEATIGVVTETVTSNSWAPVNVEANVKNLIVSNETELNIGKGIVVDKVVADAPVVIKGDGKITELEANSDGVKADVPVNKVTGDNKGDVTNTEGGVVEKPSTGGGSSGGNGGGSVTPPTPDKTIALVGSEADFNKEMTNPEVKTIKFTQDFITTKTLVVNRQVIIDGNGKTLTCTDAVNNKGIEGNALLIKIANGVTVKNLNVVMDAAGNTDINGKDKWDSVYGIQVYNSTGVTLDNVSSKLGDGGILVNSSTVTLTGNINVSGNQFGGIEVSKSANSDITSVLDVTDAKLKNSSQSDTNPTIWVLDGQGKLEPENHNLPSKSVKVEGEKDKTYYFVTSTDIDNEDDFRLALTDTYIETINVTAPISNIAKTLVVDRELTINGGSNKLTFTKAINELPKKDGRNGLLIKNTSGPVTITDLAIEMKANDGLQTDNSWNGVYGIQVFNSKDVTLDKVSSTSGDGGIIINSSNVKIGDTTVTGNEFGGIELNRSKDDKGSPLDEPTLTITGTITNNSEAYGQPTIWIAEKDEFTDISSVITFGTQKFKATPDVKDDQIQYYFEKENAALVTIGDVTGPITADIESDFSITCQTSGVKKLIRWKAVLMIKNESNELVPVANQEIKYKEGDLFKAFTTDVNGEAKFGPAEGFLPSTIGLDKEPGVTTNFKVTLPEGAYTLEISLVDMNGDVVGKARTLTVTVSAANDANLAETTDKNDVTPEDSTSPSEGDNPAEVAPVVE